MQHFGEKSKCDKVCEHISTCEACIWLQNEFIQDPSFYTKHYLIILLTQQVVISWRTISLSFCEFPVFGVCAWRSPAHGLRHSHSREVWWKAAGEELTKSPSHSSGRELAYKAPSLHLLHAGLTRQSNCVIIGTQSNKFSLLFMNLSIQ